jgi:ribosomal-protein-alanine N-acetyltransferase
MFHLGREHRSRWCWQPGTARLREEKLMAVFDFGAFPVLATARLDLVELQPKFVEDIFVVRGDPVVQLYNSAPHETRDETLRFIAEQRSKYARRQEVTWALLVRDLRRVVGCVSLFDWDPYHRRAQIGYDLALDQWGNGLAQEAVRGVLAFAFSELNLNRVEIWTSSANERSLKLASRLGFTLEGTLRRRILEDDRQFHDCTIFGLLRSEWLPR